MLLLKGAWEELASCRLWLLPPHPKFVRALCYPSSTTCMCFLFPCDAIPPGPVFGSKDNFHGLAIFLDTYPNDETTEVLTPFL